VTELKTARLHLTPPQPQDFADLKKLWAGEDITRFITGRPLSGEEVWLRLLRDIGHWASLGHGNWCIKLQNGTLIGSVGLFDYKREMTPPFTDIEVGWGMDPVYQGQGLAHEALSAVLDHADEKLALSRTVCMISAENLASIRLAQKAGFTFCGDGHYKDGVVGLYERLRPGG